SVGNCAIPGTAGAANALCGRARRTPAAGLGWLDQPAGRAGRWRGVGCVSENLEEDVCRWGAFAAARAGFRLDRLALADLGRALHSAVVGGGARAGRRRAL